MSLVLTMAVVARGDDVYLLIAPGLGCVLGAIISFTYRTKPPSRVYKRAELDLLAASPNAFQRCIEAVTVVGGKIAKIDGESEPKLIVARTGMTWRSHGCIVSLTVSSPAPDRSHVLIESDAISPAALFDWGQNSRNIRLITHQILRR
jgi:hypothetical protein